MTGPVQAVGPVGLWPYHFFFKYEGLHANIHTYVVGQFSPALARIFTQGCTRSHLGAPKCKRV